LPLPPGHYWLCSIFFVTGFFAAVWSSLAVQHPFCYRAICCSMVIIGCAASFLLQDYLLQDGSFDTLALVLSASS
jgi:hypothetical protein